VVHTGVEIQVANMSVGIRAIFDKDTTKETKHEYKGALF